jgi:hypothetical protein
MKYFPPLALAILSTACATNPLDPEAMHQHQLEKEARANFIALKQQEHPDRPVVLHDDMPRATPAPRSSSSLAQQQPAPTPQTKAKRQAMAKPRTTPAPQPYVAAQPVQPARRAPRTTDDTVYYWQVAPAARQHSTAREQVAEAKYARSLAKRPEDLTPEERLWAHEHY